MDKRQLKPQLQAFQRGLTGPVAVLMGGRSAEREISLKSGTAVLEALQRLGIPAEAVDTADSGWLRRLADRCTCAFVALHGPGGEDGTVQGALETLEIPYTGSGVLASALAIDKVRCKHLWRGMGLPTPAFFVLSETSEWSLISEQLGDSIVKPSREGSSIGMARASGAGELQRAFEAARRYGEVLAEEWISGEEYTVSVIGRETLPAIRLETDSAFYDYEAKYVSSSTRYHCPCGLSAADERRLSDLALQAYDSLGCSGWGRVDVMRDREGEFFLLEVNTIPGMTDHSLVPMAAKQAGLNFDELVVAILMASINGEVGDGSR